MANFTQLYAMQNALVLKGERVEAQRIPMVKSKG